MSLVNISSKEQFSSLLGEYEFLVADCEFLAQPLFSRGYHPTFALKALFIYYRV